jgi:hypothetical protein
MSSDKKGTTLKIGDIAMSDSMKAQRLETLNLNTVVHNVAKRIYLAMAL